MSSTTTHHASATTNRLRIGVSSCLLGEKVRYNGGHTRNDFMLNVLGPWVDWISVCPEVEIGLGIPRESLRLIGTVEQPRMVAPRSGTDHTDTMTTWAGPRVEALRAQQLDGYILKKGSPSCGLFRVKVYGEKNIPLAEGRGLFAEALTRAMPLLPVEEEGRLNDAGLRENFIQRLFAYRRWRELLKEPSIHQLGQFQADFKMVLMAHSPAGQKELGRLVADPKALSLPDLLDAYGSLFMKVLGTIATPQRQTNVLQHLMGFLKNHLDTGDKAELVELIEAYRMGQVPLIVPITLLKHHIRRADTPEWLDRQVYLNPYPGELMLRNRI